MNKNIEILKQLSVPDTSNWKKDYDYRENNQGWLTISARIAFTILSTLKKKGLSQKEFGELLGVQPPRVSKMLKGKENFTLQTLDKIQKVLQIDLLTINSVENFWWSKNSNQFEDDDNHRRY